MANGILASQLYSQEEKVLTPEVLVFYIWYLVLCYIAFVLEFDPLIDM